MRCYANAANISNEASVTCSTNWPDCFQARKVISICQPAEWSLASSAVPMRSAQTLVMRKKLLVRHEQPLLHQRFCILSNEVVSECFVLF